MKNAQKKKVIPLGHNSALQRCAYTYKQLLTYGLVIHRELAL